MTAPATTAVAGLAAYRILDSAYRAANARIALTVARAMLVYWASVDPRNLRGTTPIWLDQSIEQILLGQTQISQLADVYTDRVRRLSLPNASPFVPPNPRPPNVEQIRNSLEFVAVKRTGRDLYALENSLNQWGEDPEFAREQAESNQRTLDGGMNRIMEDAIVRAAGTAIRHVTTAGRNKLEDNVLADKLAVGWARTTKPGCCYFCAMLASRGRVYKEDSFEFSNEQFKGAGEQKVHDHCGCGLRPLYSREDPLPDRSAELEQLWIDSGSTKRREESAINAFRRLYEASPLAQRVE